MYGLTKVYICRIAFKLAVKLNVQHYFNVETIMAGKKWLRSSRKRYFDLLIRIPEATNIFHAVDFNLAQVSIFTSLLKDCLNTGKLHCTEYLEC